LRTISRPLGNLSREMELKLVNPDKAQTSKSLDLEEVVKNLEGAVKDISYKLSRAEKGFGYNSQ
ncbi:hypothetical protein KI387_026820, partial [Taxus chinensis]